MNINLRKTYMCSICLPQSGQAPASHVSQQRGQMSLCGAAGLRAMQANPFIHDVNQHNATLFQAAKLVMRGLNGTMPEYATLFGWWSQTGSNRRPEACKATALPTELWPRLNPDILKAQAHTAKPRSWWAWEDLNFRPHAYQARALTN